MGNRESLRRNAQKEYERVISHCDSGRTYLILDEIFCANFNFAYMTSCATLSPDLTVVEALQPVVLFLLAYGIHTDNEGMLQDENYK